MKKKKLLVHAWRVFEFDGVFYLPYTHWVYLVEMHKIFDEIGLLSPVRLCLSKDEVSGMAAVRHKGTLVVHRLPDAASYVASVPNVLRYLTAYRRLSRMYSHSYVRYPVPFGWMQRIFFQLNTIIHYVGDPIDTINKNPHIGIAKKLIYRFFFFPENSFYIWASRGAARVVANGTHLATKLASQGVKAVPMISSTLSQADFFDNAAKCISTETPSIVYVGYLRKAKGIETVLEAFTLLRSKYPKAQLSIIGSGEAEASLRSMVSQVPIPNVEFKGHIEDRSHLNSLLRSADIFCFASLSEGSPRVILEAMANRLNVVSTPVGSLPTVFQDKKDIVFAEANNASDFAAKMEWVISNIEHAKMIRDAAYEKVRAMTSEKFIQEIFVAA